MQELSVGPSSRPSDHTMAPGKSRGRGKPQRTAVKTPVVKHQAKVSPGTNNKPEKKLAPPSLSDSIPNLAQVPKSKSHFQSPKNSEGRRAKPLQADSLPDLTTDVSPAPEKKIEPNLPPRSCNDSTEVLLSKSVKVPHTAPAPRRSANGQANRGPPRWTKQPPRRPKEGSSDFRLILSENKGLFQYLVRFEPLCQDAKQRWALLEKMLPSKRGKFSYFTLICEGYKCKA